MSRRIGRSNSLARRNASSPHGYQSTGWCAAPLRYVDVSFERRFPRVSVTRPAQGPRRLWLLGTGRIRQMRIGLRLVQAFRKLLAELRNLRGDDDPAVPGRRILAEVVLVVFLGAVERTGRLDLGDDRMSPDFVIVHFLADLPRHLLLLRGMIEVCGSVLRTAIRSLTAECLSMVLG